MLERRQRRIVAHTQSRGWRDVARARALSVATQWAFACNALAGFTLRPPDRNPAARNKNTPSTRRQTLEARSLFPPTRCLQLTRCGVSHSPRVQTAVTSAIQWERPRWPHRQGNAPRSRPARLIIAHLFLAPLAANLLSCARRYTFKRSPSSPAGRVFATTFALFMLEIVSKSNWAPSCQTAKVVPQSTNCYSALLRELVSSRLAMEFLSATALLIGNCQRACT